MKTYSIFRYSEEVYYVSNDIISPILEKTNSIETWSHGFFCQDEISEAAISIVMNYSGLSGVDLCVYKIDDIDNKEYEELIFFLDDEKLESDKLGSIVCVKKPIYNLYRYVHRENIYLFYISDRVVEFKNIKSLSKSKMTENQINSLMWENLFIGAGVYVHKIDSPKSTGYELLSSIIFLESEEDS